MPAGPRLPRRTALALAVAGLVAVAGCDDGEKPGSALAPTPDPDTALVDRVLVELGNAEQLAEAAGLIELSAMHRAHIKALGGPEPTPNPARMSVAVARRKEQHLQRYLAGAALDAGSGQLARLLASMSAAVAQRLAGGLA